MELNIAVAYGGRQEIADAVRVGFLRDLAYQGGEAYEAVDCITPESIAMGLYTAGLPDPDLIIRTSGRSACRGFCCGKAFTASSISPTSIGRPSTRYDFLRAVRAYQARQRRLGR